MRETPSNHVLTNTKAEEQNEDVNTPWYLNTFLTNFFAGGVAASVAVTAIAPFERIKLILQVQKSAKNIENEYKGILDCLRRIPKEQGYLSFWRGNTASVLRCFPYQALNFSLKDKLRETFHKAIDASQLSNRVLINLVAGGLAGSSALALIYPLDYARTRLAVDTGSGKQREFTTIRQTLRYTYKWEGLQGLYRGFSFSVLGVFLYRSVYFGIFDTGLEILPPDYRHAFWVQFVMAEISAISGSTVSYPIDTVRRSMMLQSGRKHKLYTGSIDCYKKIYASQGIFGFYHGVVANILRGTGGALMLIFYDKAQLHVTEVTQRHLEKTNQTVGSEKSVVTKAERSFWLPPSGLTDKNIKKKGFAEGRFHFCLF